MNHSTNNNTTTGLDETIRRHREQYFTIIGGAEFTEGTSTIPADRWYREVTQSLSSIKKSGNRMYFIGNGASSSMSSHFATDFAKNGGIPSFSLNEGSLLTCFSNDFSYETAYAEMLKRFMRPADMLVAISSSGSSRNIITAVAAAREHVHGAVIVTFSGFRKDNPLRRAGDFNLYLANDDYGFVESGHAYYLHLLIDLFIQLS